MQLRQEGFKIAGLENTLEVEASYIRGMKVNWHVFFQAQLLSSSDYRIITDYDNGDFEVKAWLLRNFRYKVGDALLCLMLKLTKEETIRSILVMIDDMLQEGRKISDVFMEKPSRRAHPECRQFLTLLSSEDQFTANISAKIISKLGTWGTVLLDDIDVSIYLDWLTKQLGKPQNMYVQNIASCLQRMIRISTYQKYVIASKSMLYILQTLEWVTHTQVIYQLLYSIWRVTFNPFAANAANKYEVITVLAPMLTDSENKVVRMVLGVFRNLIVNSRFKTSNKHCARMIQHKVLKYLSILQYRDFHDEDITDDIEFLNDKLQRMVTKISSFSAFSTEVKSKTLEWSPVHKSAQFWRENAARLSDNNYELLRILLNLLETSRDLMTLRVACFDIGQYIVHYRPGKRIVQVLGGKDSIMKLLANDDPLVRTEALLTLQKIMIQNQDLLGWE